MRDLITLSSLVALAAAKFSGEPPNENITIIVGACSSLESYQLVANGIAYLELILAITGLRGSSMNSIVPGPQAREKETLLSIFLPDVGGVTCELSRKSVDEDFQCPWVLTVPNGLGVPKYIPGAEDSSPDLNSVGDDTAQSVTTCINGAGDIQIAICCPGKQLKGCKNIQLEYKAGCLNGP
ncbi:hypothetical protein GGR50DRAFT_694381 [Xylaria sp. CBS 124048]|nr:hypothetical protein GGR50DRAFT_694381 [Xylaria sp. CBS 124048]